MGRWRPVHVVVLVVATVGGLASAAFLAFVGFLLAQPFYWDGAEKPLGDRLHGLVCIAVAGVVAASGPLLAGELRRSFAATVVGGILIGLGVTAAVVVGVVTA